MIRRRMGRPGLIGAAARTAVVAGTATAVSQRVQRSAAERDAERNAPQAEQPSAAASTGPVDTRVDQLRTLADLKTQGVLTEEEFAAEKARILSA